MQIGCIIQARTTSTRLPKKVLKTIDYVRKRTILEEVIRRVKLSKKIDKIVIATTKNKSDDDIVNISQKEGIGWFRGSENDVLSRYFFAAKENRFDHIVRITSDCPFIDPYVIDNLIELYIEGEYDYASNCILRTFPHGLDCEIFSFEGLKYIYENAVKSSHREHVTSFFYENKDKFKIGELALKEEDYSNIRITVDTKEDYLLACIIQDYLSEGQEAFSNIVRLFKEKPYLKEINSNILQKKIYDTVTDEIRAAINVLKLQEMERAAQLLEKYNNGDDR